MEQTSFQQDIESLIDNQRASLAVPLTSKQQAQAAAAPAQAKDQTLTAPLTPEQK
jgi:ribosomal protein L12E/L44/L45/RPP1/RPP2